jgi:hypothetical protein
MNAGFVGVVGAALLAALGIVGCAGGQPPSEPSSAAGKSCKERTNGAEIEIQVNDETYRLWSVDTAFIAKAKQLNASGKANVASFGGLADGRDCDPTSTFHTTASDMKWVELSIEGCDGRPSDIEKDKAHWINDVKHWCPWSTKVISVEER